MNKSKSFVLDTSVILDSPENIITLSQNGENTLYITDIVLKELNKRKEDMMSEAGFLARQFSSALDRGLQKKKSSNIVNNRKGMKRVKVKKKKYREEITDKNSNDIIQTFFCLFEGEKKSIEINIISRRKYEADSFSNDLKIVEIARDYNYTLITNDIYLKFEALARNVSSESMQKGRINSPEEISFSKDIFGTEETKEELLADALKTLKEWNQVTFYHNEIGKEGKREHFIVKKNSTGKYYKEVKRDIDKRYTVPPIGEEQRFYTELLSSDFNIAVVTGSTGSGKTLMAVQEGMKRVKDKNDPIDGIVYIRNTVTSNDKASELGFRKGDQDQKLGYFAYPLYGALNFIAQKSISRSKTDFNEQQERKESPSKEYYTEQMMEDYNIEVMDIAHARGITIPNKFVIFDEGQNAPDLTVKLIGTRMGKGSRLVIMGDFRQLDHPYLTTNRNGLVTMLKIAEDKGEIIGIQLKKTIRSEIANWFEDNL